MDIVGDQLNLLYNQPIAKIKTKLMTGASIIPAIIPSTVKKKNICHWLIISTAPI